MKNKIIFFHLLLIFSVSAFAQTMPKDADANLWQKALKIHKKALIVDGHNDITSPMYDEDFSLASDSVGKFHLTAILSTRISLASRKENHGTFSSRSMFREPMPKKRLLAQCKER